MLMKEFSLDKLIRKWKSKDLIKNKENIYAYN